MVDATAAAVIVTADTAEERERERERERESWFVSRLGVYFVSSLYLVQCAWRRLKDL